jgi:hypothetical protein
MHNKKFLFILQATCFGSILNHHQAFSKNVNMESLKMQYNANLPLTLKYIINLHKYVKGCLIQDALIKKYAGIAATKLPFQVPAAVDVCCLTSSDNFNNPVSNNP